MRLSAEIIQTAEQRTNPLGERELILRSLAIPTIEHLSVTRDAFDSIDLSNNHICKLENFPRLQRLSALHLGGNGVEVVDGRNLRKNLPQLKTLVLSGCSVRGWNVLGELGVGCPMLEVLSLVGNPVTSKFLQPFVLICWFCFVLFDVMIELAQLENDCFDREGCDSPV